MNGGGNDYYSDTGSSASGSDTLLVTCVDRLAAMANEFKTVLAIKHDAQIAYDETYDAGFRNSYTALWETFDAAEIDRHVYMLDLPLKLRPLQSVNPVHRRRARERRSHWDDIMQSARSSMLIYLAKGVALDIPRQPGWEGDFGRYFSSQAHGTA